MLAKVQKWGNSLAIRLPKILTQEIDLTKDAPVDLRIEDRSIVITPVEKFSLDAMLAQVSDANIYREADFGREAGKELW